MTQKTLIILLSTISWFTFANNHTEENKINKNNNINDISQSDSSKKEDTILLSAASAEDKLEAIKQALVDLALDSNVKIHSKAYLDGEGVLHESSTMTSDVEIRGVRVEYWYPALQE